MNLLLYSKFLGPRVNYVVKTLFEDIAGYQLVMTQDADFFAHAEGAKIEYSNICINALSFSIPVHPFILEKSIVAQPIKIAESHQLPAFFYCQPSSPTSLPFDLFSMAFYLLSRYEEYLPFSKDEHGRFSAQQSLAFKNQFLHQPLIDQWMAFVKEALYQRFGLLPSKGQTYQYIPTIDIDFAWSYLHKNPFRSGGGLLKDLLSGQPKKVSKRLAVLRGQEADPYFQFDFLNRLHQKHNCQAIFFFLFGAYGSFDKNTSADHPAMQKLVQAQSELSDIGIHPSYASHDDEQQLKKEKEDLAGVSNQVITKSRQHFLKLTFPTTYQKLLSVGIQSDYTMGYAEDVGFRASTSHPFYWYDLENEAETRLKVHPFQIMDVTLKNYLNLNPDEALATCQEIIDVVKSVNGNLVTIWHNSSFSSLMGWDDWKKVYPAIIKNAV